MNELNTINQTNVDVPNIMSDLNIKQQKFVHTYILGQYSNKQLSNLLDVNINTIYAWLKKDDIREAINYYLDIEKQTVETGIVNSSSKALNKMINLIDSPVDAIAFQASKDILDRSGHKPKQEVKIDKKVMNFEMQLKELIDKTIDVEDYEVKD